MTTTSDLYPGLPDPERRPDVYAGVPLKRGFAWIVDAILIGLLSFAIALLTLGLGFLIFGAIAFVVGFLYRWFTIAASSSTLGMRLTAIEFRDRLGEPLDSGQALLHTTGYTLSVMIFPLQLVSIVLMLISQRGQGLTDHVLGTTAINRLI